MANTNPRLKCGVILYYVYIIQLVIGELFDMFDERIRARTILNVS